MQTATEHSCRKKVNNDVLPNHRSGLTMVLFAVSIHRRGRCDRNDRIIIISFNQHAANDAAMLQQRQSINRSHENSRDRR